MIIGSEDKPGKIRLIPTAKESIDALIKIQSNKEMIVKSNLFEEIPKAYENAIRNGERVFYISFENLILDTHIDKDKVRSLVEELLDDPDYEVEIVNNLNQSFQRSEKSMIRVTF